MIFKIFINQKNIIIFYKLNIQSSMMEWIFQTIKWLILGILKIIP